MEILRTRWWVLTNLLVIVGVGVLTQKVEKAEEPNSLLLILLDGFRWDYFQIPGLKGFPRVMKEGIHAEYMEALYPSESYPGYYSIATGRYGESHGMVLNYMYDKDHNETFKMEPDPVSQHSFWWEDAEPIWITATRHNVTTALYLWPGGDVMIHDLKAQRVKPYEQMMDAENFKVDLANALDAFQKNEIRFAQVYCEYPDKVGHGYGPFSPALNRSILEIDQVIDRLMDQIKEKGLEKKLHVIIVSDHGMTKTDNASVKLVSLQTVLDPNDVQYVLDRGSHAGIYPVAGRDDKVFQDLQKLKGVDVYKKADIPDRFHFKHHRRVPPIYIVVKKGFFLTGLSDPSKQVPLDSPFHTWNGFHGYDPKESDMNAIFLAWGPTLKKNHASPPINITDPYNLMTKLLQIPSEPNNGSWTNVEHMLLNSGHTAQSFGLNLWAVVVANIPLLYLSHFLVF